MCRVLSAVAALALLIGPALAQDVGVPKKKKPAVKQAGKETGEKKAALDTYKKLIEVHPYWSGASEAMDELKREVEGQGI